MKKLSLTIVLCLTIALSFGQKKAVSDANREIGKMNPNFENARNLIKGALVDPETKDNAETWFTAGKVEGKQFDYEKTIKPLQNQTQDTAVMYGALKNVKSFFVVSDSLEMLPDEKTKKVKLKFRKDMKVIMLANRLSYLEGGGFFFNNRDYENAFDMFQQFFDIPKMNMFEGENIAAKDTAFAQYRYYAGIALSQFGDTAKIISFFEGLRNNNGYKEEDVYKYLSSLYKQTGDAVNLIRILREGSEKFSNEPYFLFNLVDLYISSNQGDVAIAMVTKAIETMPDRADLYNALGIVYENSKQDPEKAKTLYEKALSIDPDYVEAIGNLGRIYFNRAIEAQVAANDIKDNQQYEIAKAKAMDIFKEALPFFEKAHQMNPEERDYMTALSRIYYALNMSDKFDEMEKKLGNQ